MTASFARENQLVSLLLRRLKTCAIKSCPSSTITETPRLMYVAHEKANAIEVSSVGHSLYSTLIGATPVQQLQMQTQTEPKNEQETEQTDACSTL